MSRGRSIRARHAIDVVEAGYSLAGTDPEWMARILEVAEPDIDYGRGSYGFVCRITPTELELLPTYAERALDPRFGALIAQINRERPEAAHEVMSRRVVTAGGIAEFFGPDHVVTHHIRAAGRVAGVVDAFALFAQDGEGYAIDLTGPSGTPLEMGSRVRGIWRRLGLHLAAGVRLRRRLAERREQLDAVLDPGGAVHHAEGTAKEERSARDTLVRAVRAMERARTKGTRSDPDEALELWRGLVAGEWSLVDRWESDGKRYVAAYRNRPDMRDPRALTAHERAVLAYAALGASNKEIAFALGVSIGSVATAASLLMKKLGCRRRTELAAFSRPERAERLSVSLESTEVSVLSMPQEICEPVLARLSPAERQIAARLLAGKTNAAIADERETSTHTVTNQLRRLFEKLGVSSRAEAAAVLTGASS
jgi:DNA-binding NarL/FixJ family response regulator